MQYEPLACGHLEVIWQRSCEISLIAATAPNGHAESPARQSERVGVTKTPPPSPTAAAAGAMEMAGPPQRGSEEEGEYSRRGNSIAKRPSVSNRQSPTGMVAVAMLKHFGNQQHIIVRGAGSPLLCNFMLVDKQLACLEWDAEWVWPKRQIHGVWQMPEAGCIINQPGWLSRRLLAWLMDRPWADSTIGLYPVWERQIFSMISTLDLIITKEAFQPISHRHLGGYLKCADMAHPVGIRGSALPLKTLWFLICLPDFTASRGHLGLLWPPGLWGTNWVILVRDDGPSAGCLRLNFGESSETVQELAEAEAKANKEALASQRASSLQKAPSRDAQEQESKSDAAPFTEEMLNSAVNVSSLQLLVSIPSCLSREKKCKSLYIWLECNRLSDWSVTDYLEPLPNASKYGKSARPELVASSDRVR